MAKGKNAKGKFNHASSFHVLLSCLSAKTKTQTKLKLKGEGVYFITMRPWHGCGWPITQAIMFFPFYLASTAISQNSRLLSGHLQLLTNSANAAEIPWDSIVLFINYCPAGWIQTWFRLSAENFKIVLIGWNYFLKSGYFTQKPRIQMFCGLIIFGHGDTGVEAALYTGQISADPHFSLLVLYTASIITHPPHFTYLYYSPQLWPFFHFYLGISGIEFYSSIASYSHSK